MGAICRPNLGYEYVSSSPFSTGNSTADDFNSRLSSPTRTMEGSLLFGASERARKGPDAEPHQLVPTKVLYFSDQIVKIILQLL
jgi:hypothetical protein